MEGKSGFGSVSRLVFALHVECDSGDDILLSSDSVDVALHFAISAVAAFDRIGGGGKKFVVEEGQRFFQMGGEQFIQRLAELLKATNPQPKLGEFRQRRVRTAAADRKSVV